jgi:hypothetical protein
MRSQPDRHIIKTCGGTMDFTHTLIIALLIAWGISQAISFAIQARTLLKIHEEANKTQTTMEITLETAVEILRQVKTKA